MQSTSFNYEAVSAKPVMLRPANEVQLWVIGCGGTGSFLVQLLCRVALALEARGIEAKLILVDPDRVEERNIVRQCFCQAEVGRNKAQTLALRYGAAFGLDIEAIAAPFNKSMLSSGGFRSCQVLCGCVDNAAARRSIAEAIGKPDEFTSKSIWWIDGGNSQHHGQVLAGNYSSSNPVDYFMGSFCERLPAPSIQAPELLQDRPEEHGLALSGLSCAELALANAQSLMVNPQVATLMGRYVLDLLSNKLTRFATHFDQQTGTMTSTYNTEASIVPALLG